MSPGGILLLLREGLCGSRGVWRMRRVPCLSFKVWVCVCRVGVLEGENVRAGGRKACRLGWRASWNLDRQRATFATGPLIPLFSIVSRVRCSEQCNSRRRQRIETVREVTTTRVERVCDKRAWLNSAYPLAPSRQSVLKPLVQLALRRGWFVRKDSMRTRSDCSRKWAKGREQGEVRGPKEESKAKRAGREGAWCVRVVSFNLALIGERPSFRGLGGAKGKKGGVAGSSGGEGEREGRCQNRDEGKETGRRRRAKWERINLLVSSRFLVLTTARQDVSLRGCWTALLEGPDEGGRDRRKEKRAN